MEIGKRDEEIGRKGGKDEREKWEKVKREKWKEGN